MIINAKKYKAIRGVNGVFSGESWGALKIRNGNLEISVPQKQIRADGLVKSSVQKLLNKATENGFNKEDILELEKYKVQVKAV